MTHTVTFTEPIEGVENVHLDDSKRLLVDDDDARRRAYIAVMQRTDGGVFDWFLADHDVLPSAARNATVEPPVPSAEAT